MRRRKTDLTEAGHLRLTPAALRPQPTDDESLPYPERIEIIEDWLTERRAWVKRREAFSEKHGWPGGDYARTQEEWEVHPIGDQPFNPEWEIKMGRF